MSTPEETASPNVRSKWAVLAVASVSTLLGTTDFSIVTIALPTLTDVFETSTSSIVWVALSYQLMMLGLVLPMGAAGDRFGRRNVFSLGILLYSVGLIAAAAAPNVGTLIAFRGLQGAGGAMANALSVGLVTAAFPAGQRGRALGLLASVAGVGLMAGPALGGILLDTLGWRSIFYVRAPIGLVGLVIALIFLERSHGSAERRTDITGAVVLFAAIATMTLGVNQGSAVGWASARAVALLAVSAVSFLTFVIYALRATMPVVDLRLFKDARLSMASGLMLLAGTTYMAITFVMPFYLVLGRDMAPATAGLVLLTNPAIFVVLPPITGRLADRIGARWPTTAGLVLQAVALFLLATVDAGSSLVVVVGFLALSGAGNALFQTPNQTVIMGAAPRDRVGTVSALIPSIRYAGLIIGVAIAEALFSAGLAGTGVNDASPATIVDAVRLTFPVFGGFAALAAALSLMRPRGQGATG